MKKIIKRGKFLLVIVVILCFFTIFPDNSNQKSIHDSDFNNFNTESKNIKNSAITPLSLGVRRDINYVSSDAPLNYSVYLDSGQYLVWVELESVDNDVNVKIQIATNDNFTNIISTTDRYGLKENERANLTVNSPATFYIQISCPAPQDGTFDIIVSDDLNEGYDPLVLDSSSGSKTFYSTSLGFYISLSSGSYSIVVEVVGEDIIVNIADDPLFYNIIATSNKGGVGVTETVDLNLSNAKTIYISVYDSTTIGIITVIVTSTSSSTGDDDDSKSDSDENSAIENQIILLIIIASAIGVSVPSLYIIKSRQKKAKQITAQKVRLQKISTMYADNSKLIKICTGSTALERILESKATITTISTEFLEAIKQFEWDENDKRDFIKEMLALPPNRRQAILNEMIQKSKIKEEIEEES